MARLPSWIAWVWRILGPVTGALALYAHAWLAAALYPGVALLLELFYRRSRRPR